MARQANTLVLRFFIEGSGASWHGMCIDLDIAAQGESLDEVRSVLMDMVNTYLESVVTYPEPERHRLLNRKAPLAIRMKFMLRFFMAYLVARKREGDNMSFISHRECPA